MPLTVEQFSDRLAESGILPDDSLRDFIAALPENSSARSDAEEMARELVRQKKLTKFQAEQIYAGQGALLTLGNYVILDKLGQGGMGIVLKAEHKRMKRLVAIKVMSAAAVKTPDALKRFHREVEAAAKLRHTNIVAADDADEAMGTHFLVMEYVEGSDLSAHVKRNGPFSVEQAVKCIIQAARGLEYAHKRGVVHRDIKPANLLLDREGTVKILDMGLARIEGEIGAQAELTSTGAVMGTVDYMAPEQARNTKTADARSDIYSLGISLWYLLTGRPTFDGLTLTERLLAHQTDPIPSLVDAVSRVGRVSETDHKTPLTTECGARQLDPSCDPTLTALDAVFRCMVAKKPEGRPQSMTEVIAELERCLSGGSPTVVFDRSGSSATNVTANGSSGSRDELQKFSRQLSGGDSATATFAQGSVTRNVPSSAEAETMISSADAAVTDPSTEQTLKFDTSRQQADRRGIGLQVLQSKFRKKSKRIIAMIGSVAVLLILAGIFLTQGGKPVPKDIPASLTSKKSVDDERGKVATEEPNSPQIIKEPDRVVAEWVLQNGGLISLLNQGNIEKVADLPKTPLTVVQVVIRNMPEFTKADAERLVTLSGLVNLSFQSTTIYPGAIRTLSQCRHLTNMTVLHGSTTEVTLSEVTLVPQLNAIDFTGVAVTNEVVARLGELQQLTYLKIYGCGRVTEDGVLRMAAKPPRKLHKLVINGTKLTKAGIQAIASLPHLNSFVCGQAQLDDTALKELSNCPSLSLVALDSEPGITPTAIVELQRSLANCQLRTKIPAQAPPLNRSVDYRNAIRSLQSHGFDINVFTDVVMSQTWISGDAQFPKGDVVFAEGACSRNAYGPTIEPVNRTDLYLIAQLADLRLLNLGKLPTDGLRDLLPLKNLTELTIQTSALTEADCELLASFPKLNALYAIIPNDAALATIAKLPHLGHLKFSRESQISEKGLAVLEDATTLSQVDFYFSNISREAAQAFADSRPDVIVSYRGERLVAKAIQLQGLSRENPLQQTEVVDILARVDLKKDTFYGQPGLGDWTNEGMTLVTPAGFKSGRIVLPFVPPSEYELMAVVERISGTDGVMFGVVVDGHPATVGFDTFDPRSSGISVIDFKPHPENESKFVERVLSDRNRHTIRITVGKRSIRATVDDRQVIQWEGDPQRLACFEVKGQTDKVWFGSASDQFRFHKLELRPLNGAATTPPIAKAPFTTAQAREHQDSWAKLLGTTVETINSVGAKMVLIPPGEFLMGSTDEQIAAAVTLAEELKVDQPSIARIRSSEQPQHKVVITKPFLMSVTEVTIGQYKKFAATGYKSEAEQASVDANSPTYLNPGSVVADDSPVAVLSWNDAVAYCDWLSGQEKKRYRLPTEAEWEYACRAGTTTQFSFGDDHADLPRYAWHKTIAGGRPHSVGTLSPNGFGLFDMHGNLYEWCADRYDEKWYEKSLSNDPVGPLSGIHRVVRGGGFNGFSSNLRSTYRLNNAPSDRYPNYGFRIVAELGDPVRATKTKQTVASDEWIDILPLIDPALDKFDIGRSLVGKNDWRVEQGELRYYGDEKSGKLCMPVRCLGRSLEWEFEFTRTAGDVSFNTDFPIPDGLVPLLIGNDKIAFVNQLLSDKFQIVNNQRTKVRIRVTQVERDDRLEVFINDQSVVDWKGQLAKHKINPPRTDARNPFEHVSLFASGPTQYSFRAMRLRMLSGGTAELLRASTMEATTASKLDLISLFDVDKGVAPWRNDGAKNLWTREESELKFNFDGKPGLLKFPTPRLFDANYRLELEFTRTSGTHGFNLDLPLSSGLFTINLDEGDRHRTGLGKTGQFTDSFHIEPNRRYRLIVFVDGKDQQDSVRLEVDGKPLLAWQGDRQKAAVPTRGASAENTRWPGIWIPASGSSFTFHRLQVVIP